MNWRYVDSLTQILVNNKKRLTFSLERLIRQGCPLAPYFFLFVADILEYILNDEKYGIEELKLLDNLSLISTMFANDTFLYFIY